MPCTAEAIDVFRKSKVWFGPGKAANAGGVKSRSYHVRENLARASPLLWWWFRKSVLEALGLA